MPTARCLEAHKWHWHVHQATTTAALGSAPPPPLAGVRWRWRCARAFTAQRASCSGGGAARAWANRGDCRSSSGQPSVAVISMQRLFTGFLLQCHVVLCCCFPTLMAWPLLPMPFALLYPPRRSILYPRETSESFISDSLKFIGVMLVSHIAVPEEAAALSRAVCCLPAAAANTCSFVPA